MVKKQSKGDSCERSTAQIKPFQALIVVLFGSCAHCLFQTVESSVGSYLPRDSSVSTCSTPCPDNWRNENGTASAVGESSPLPTCKSMMQHRNSPFRDGSFLTRHTIPIHWHPRVDGSRELKHSMCQLHRYSAAEARQCLQGKHLNFIGDSLTRYQFLSLAWFLHKSQYPPHFGRRKDGSPCPHFDERGQETCSPFDEPNICMENDWRGDIGDGIPKFKFAWVKLMQAVGGRYFNGHMEANAIRDFKSTDQNIVENYFYASPVEAAQNQVYLSYNNEIGWHDEPEPIRGFRYTACAFSGTCALTDLQMEERLQRAIKLNFDWSQPLERAIAPGGILERLLPPVNISLYNRGIWGAIAKERAELLMPMFHNFSGGDQGRCYFQASTGRFDWTQQAERTHVNDAAQKAGCGFIDLGHLVEDFNQLVNRFPDAPDQEYGNAQDERHFVYTDVVHFQPWVYEELNNMLLNVLCNNG